MRKLRRAAPYLLSTVVTVMFVVVFFLFMLPTHIGDYQNRGWAVYYEEREGAAVRVEEKEILPLDTGAYMKVITTRQFLDVFVGGERVFSYTGDENGRPHRGIYPILILDEYVGKTIRLEMTSPYPNDNTMMDGQFSADSYGLADAGRDFACGIIALVIGLSIAVVAVMMVIAKIGKLIVWMLAASVLLFSGFVLSSTRPAMLLMDPQVMYWLYMVCFWLYPICMFVYLYISHTESLKKALLPFLLLPILFALGCFILDVAGVASIDRYSFWYGYICFASMLVLLVGAAFGRRTTGRVSGVVLVIIGLWTVWGASLLLRDYVLHIFVRVNHEYIVVFTLVCAIEMIDNIIKYTRQLIGMRYRELYLTEKNRHLARYYENIEQHLHDVAVLKHEMNHHLVTLNYLHRDRAFDSAGAYLENIGVQYQAADTMNYCDNHIVNAVLSYLTTEAEKLGARLETSCSVARQLNMPDEDLSSLLLNLVENALESCAKVDEAEGRNIKLAMRFENSLFFVGVENSMREAQQKGGRFLSAKRDYEQQGYGLEVIDRIVKRYEGTLEVAAEKGWFKVELLLNLPVQQAVDSQN